MLPATLMLTTVIPQATVIVAIGRAAVLATLAVAALLALLIRGAVTEHRNGDRRARVEPCLPLHPPLAPPDREAPREAA